MSVDAMRLRAGLVVISGGGATGTAGAFWYGGFPAALAVFAVVTAALCVWIIQQSRD